MVLRITVAATPYGRLATTLFGGRVERREVELDGVGEVQRGVRVRVQRVPERRLQAAVELDDVHVPRALREVLAEHAEAAADLEHDVVLGQLRGAADHVEDVRVDEEVLAQLAVRPDAELAHPADARLGHHQPNSLVALASTAASSSA